MTAKKRKRTARNSPDPIDLHVGARVKTRRVGMRMSQSKLGQAIGVTFQQIQKYENGTNRIGASNLHRIANVLEVEVAYFYEGVERTQAVAGMEEAATPFTHDPMSSREAIELMHNYFRIQDSTVRKRLFQFVRSLANNPPEE